VAKLQESARKEFKLRVARVLSKITKLAKVNKMFERAETTLCLVISLDGKITTGSTDNLDSDLDWKRIVGVKEGFAQYYKIEQSLGPNYLNSGRVLEKVGFNSKKGVPEKEPLKFVVVDRKPHLNKHGINYLCNWLEKLFIVTTNPKHPVFELKSAHDNIQIIYYETDVDFPDLLEKLWKHHKIEKITIESGGTLNAIFFRNSLVDHVKIVVAPLIVGGKDTSSLVDGSSLTDQSQLHLLKALKLKECKKLENSYLLLEYDVINDTVIE
jgi:2,5-diamino-6-(ribosylamino)-4(3H)-pyrimidinone 5'-phosphate reductase